jgi:hypothetical protein
MDSIAAEPVLQQVLTVIVDGGSPWSSGASNTGATRRGSPTILHAPRGPVFIDPEGLPSSIRAAWSARVQFMSATAWKARDVREAGVFYTITPLQSWGHFVRVQLTAVERNARSSDQAPAVNASGITYFLMSRDGGWVIVATNEWVT